MFYFKLVCDCGFQSEAVALGMIKRYPDVFSIPVFDVASGRLFSFTFSETETGLSDIQLADWVDENGEKEVQRQLGAGAFSVAENRTKFVRCPSCKKGTGRFVDAGF